MIRRRLTHAMSPQEREKGFTLIELMVIVIIIAILAALAIPLLRGQAKKGHDSTAKTDLRNAITTVNSYFADTNSTYPATSIAWTNANLPGGTYNYLGTNNVLKRSESNTIAIYADNRPGFVGYCAWTTSPEGNGVWYFYDSSGGSITTQSTAAYPNTPICHDIALNGNPI